MILVNTETNWLFFFEILFFFSYLKRLINKGFHLFFIFQTHPLRVNNTFENKDNFANNYMLGYFRNLPSSNLITNTLNMSRINKIDLLQVANLLQKEEKSFVTISKQMPCYLFLNSTDNFSFLKIDSKLSNTSSLPLKKDISSEQSILEQFVHKKSLKQISKTFLNYINGFNYDKPLSFIQEIEYAHNHKIELYYIRGKVINNQKVVSLCIPLQNMNLFNHDSLKLFENSLFIKKNLERYSSITNTELKVCKHLCKGKRLKEIAELFQKSEHTIKNHKNSLYKKMGVTNFFDFYNFSHKFKIDIL